MRHDPIDPARSWGPERPGADVSEQSLNAVRHELDALERRALATIAASEEELRALESGATGGAQDDAARLLAMTVLAEVVTRERRTVEEIAAARSRLFEGTFGRCEACGHIIAQSRLHAVPTARHCVACQADAEHTPPAAA